MKSMRAVEEVLDEDPKTRDPKYGWGFLIKVLGKLGYKVYIDLRRGIPSPETLFRERREIINRKNRYKKEFVPEPGMVYEKPSQ